jgi:hypothetical protein
MPFKGSMRQRTVKTGRFVVRRYILVGLSALLSSLTILAIADDKSPSPAEQAKAIEAAKQRMLKQFDLNGDGVLNDQEKARAEEAMRAQGFPMMAGGAVGNDPFLRQFDRDGDGKLNPAEQRAARDAWERMRRNNGGPQRGFTPGGGTPAPAGAASKAEAKPEKVSPLVKRFDKDGDGKLNEEEKAAAQAELKGKKQDKAEKPKDKDDKKPAEKAGK